MGYEISNDMLRTAQLARQLEASEADLRETQKRMELAANAAELGMWMWDIVRDEIWITDKGRALFGFGPSEKLNFDRFRSRVHPEDRELVLRSVRKLLAHRRRISNLSTDWCCRMGRYAGSPGAGQVEFNGEGQPVRMRGASLDITKRKHAEEQAARHRNEMAHLFTCDHPWRTLRLNCARTYPAAQHHSLVTLRLLSESSRTARATSPRFGQFSMRS